MIVYISIGNSDDKLSQSEWSRFYDRTDRVVRYYVDAVHGAWASLSTAPWQNACWCIETDSTDRLVRLKDLLSDVAGQYRQDSIAWTEAPVTEFIRPEVQA